MIRWVLDAAALVDLLVVADPPPDLREAFRYERCAAPAVIDLHAAALLSRLVDASALPEAEALQVLDDVHAAPVQRFDTVPLRARAWELRRPAGPSAATYISLAEILDVPLLTCTPGLALTTGHRARISLVSAPG